MALKDIFTKVYFNSDLKMLSFSQQSRDKSNGLMYAQDKSNGLMYAQDLLKKLYVEYIEIGRRLLMDTLLFVKEAITTAMFDIMHAAPDHSHAEYILSLLLNKLGDKDNVYVKSLLIQLTKLLAYKKQL